MNEGMLGVFKMSGANFFWMGALKVGKQRYAE